MESEGKAGSARPTPTLHISRGVFPLRPLGKDAPEQKFQDSSVSKLCVVVALVTSTQEVLKHVLDHTSDN